MNKKLSEEVIYLRCIFFTFLFFFIPFSQLSADTIITFPDRIDTFQEHLNVQIVLNKVLTPSPNLVVDGKIGRKTTQAVQSFQEFSGLVPDGKIGPLTRLAFEQAQKNNILDCSNGALFDSSTGQSCSAILRYHPGCTSFSGFSITTGKPCIYSGITRRSVDNQDRTKPIITSFTIPSSSISFLVPINTLTATDNILVTGYIITETPSVPSLSSNLWSLTPSTEYTFYSSGLHTVYAWARDANGNISNPVSNQITIIPPYITINSPTYSSIQPTNNVELSFTVSGEPSSCWYDLGGLILEYNITNNIPSTPNDPIDPDYQYPLPDCQSTIMNLPNDYYTLNLFAKHSSGNYNFSSATFEVSSGSPPDITPPTVSSFSIPPTSTSLTVPILSLEASDAVGITGYLINESPIVPNPSSIMWESFIIDNYVFDTQGVHTLYAWVKDGAGNVSLPGIASVDITTVLGEIKYNFTQKLTLGMRSNEVKELQKILISQNYLKIKNETNYFGNLTLNALLKYQKDNNLTPDGVVGRKTREVLNR